MGNNDGPETPRAGTAAIAHLREILAPGAGETSATQRFAVVPLSRRDAFLVPLDSRAAARRSLSEYAALRPLPKRLVRQVLGAAWSLGLPELALRGRATLPTGAETLLGHLREVLGETELTFATGLRWVGSFYTPVLQLFRLDGTPVAYAKIGWDEVTSVQVRAEVDALRRVNDASTELLHAPRLLHGGAWGPLELCVTAPLPRRARRVPAAMLPPVLALREVGALDAPLTVATLRDSRWWKQVMADAPTLDAQAPGLLDALGAIDARFGDIDLQFGRWHGDWVAWNMALAPEGLYVWDWEYSRPDVPFGSDLLHFCFQDAFVVDGRPLLQAFERAGAAASAGLRRLGVDSDAQIVLRLLHRLELRLRAERAVQQGAQADPGVRDTAISTLLSLPDGKQGSSTP